MDRNAYQSELDQVQFTEAGRSALTDALMAEQAGPPVQHRSLWMKRGMAAVLAAVLLVGTAAAVTASLWDSFFGRLDPGEQAVVDTLSGGLPGAVSAGGAMMTPMAAFGMDGAFYLMLEIQAPEGTVLPPLDGENETYQLFGDDILNGEWLELREPDGPRGALVCEYDFFKILYHAEARSILRSGNAVHIGLLSVTSESGGELPKRSLDRVMENLLDLIRSCLRKGDIASRCSVSQFILMLPQANYENSCMVCERIIKSFCRQYPHSPAQLHYTVQPLEPHV